jgi:hypothetical protein
MQGERCMQHVGRRRKPIETLGRYRWILENNIKMNIKIERNFGLGTRAPVLGPVARFCDHDNEPSGSMKHRELVEKVKQNPVPGRWFLLELLGML